MSERTIRTLAKELAGEFYEQKRSDRFRSKNSKTRAKMLKQLPDGTAIEIDVIVPFIEAYPTSKQFSIAHWPLFYDVARKCLVTMLAMDCVHDNLKQAIRDALVEDRQKQINNEARGKPRQNLIQGQMQ